MAIKNSVSINFYLRSSIVLTFSIATYPKRLEYQTVWIQVRPDILSGYQQMALVGSELIPFNNGKLLRTFCPSSLNLNLETCKEPRTYLNGKNVIRSTVKHVLSGHSKKKKTKVLKIDVSLMQVESIAECSHLEHSAILLTCSKYYSVLKNNFWSSFEWPLKTGFTVYTPNVT